MFELGILGFDIATWSLIELTLEHFTYTTTTLKPPYKLQLLKAPFELVLGCFFVVCFHSHRTHPIKVREIPGNREFHQGKSLGEGNSWVEGNP